MRSILLLVFAAAAPVALADTAAEEARIEVQRALQGVVDAGWFHARASGHVFGPDQPPVRGSVSVVLPDRAHVRSDGLEFILLPEGAWIAALGFWTPADPALLPVTRFEPAAMQRAIDEVRDVELLGTSQTAQCPSRVYRFRTAGQLPGAPAEGEVQLWVCDDSYRPARMEVTEADTGRRAVLDFDWSRRVEVRAPLAPR